MTIDDVFHETPPKVDSLDRRPMQEALKDPSLERSLNLDSISSPGPAAVPSAVVMPVVVPDPGSVQLDGSLDDLPPIVLSAFENEPKGIHTVNVTVDVINSKTSHPDVVEDYEEIIEKTPTTGKRMVMEISFEG